MSKSRLKIVWHFNWHKQRRERNKNVEKQTLSNVDKCNISIHSIEIAVIHGIRCLGIWLEFAVHRHLTFEKSKFPHSISIDLTCRLPSRMWVAYHTYHKIFHINSYWLCANSAHFFNGSVFLLQTFIQRPQWCRYSGEHFANIKLFLAVKARVVS